MKKLLIGVLVASTAIAVSAKASETLTAEPSPDSYNYVSSYRVGIDAPAADVWPHLIDLGSWMYDFDMAPEKGDPGAVGQVLRLYPGQDFFVQIVSMTPNQNLVVANLPATFRDEFSTGIAVMDLVETGEKTTLSLTMSRRYTWQGEKGENPLRAMRSSEQFQQGSKATWTRFLDRLKSLAEAAGN